MNFGLLMAFLRAFILGAVGLYLGLVSVVLRAERGGDPTGRGICLRRWGGGGGADAGASEKRSIHGQQWVRSSE